MADGNSTFEKMSDFQILMGLGLRFLLQKRPIWCINPFNFSDFPQF